MQLPLVGEAERRLAQQRHRLGRVVGEELALGEVQEGLRLRLLGRQAQRTARQLRVKERGDGDGAGGGGVALHGGEASEDDEDLPDERLGAEREAVRQVLQHQAPEAQLGHQQVLQDAGL